MDGVELSGLVVAAHLGALHPWEQALTAVLVFGPFVVLGVVVTLRQRALRLLEPVEPVEPVGAADATAPADGEVDER